AKVAEGQREPFMLHVATSLITGVVATTVAAPFDKLKSCVMADDGSRFPRGFLDALRFTLREEGAASLFRGWWPAYCRLGPHAILTFPLLEQVRKALGLEYLCIMSPRAGNETRNLCSVWPSSAKGLGASSMSSVQGWEISRTGRDGGLLFFRSFRKASVPPDADDLELQLLLHAALDQAEVQLQNVAQALQKGEAKGSDPYVGILSPALFDVEDCNIYGYVAATRVKVLAIVRDGACRQRRDEEAILRSMLRQLNLLYVDAASNPFYDGLGKANLSPSLTHLPTMTALLFDVPRDELKHRLETICEDSELSLSTDCSEAGSESPVSLDTTEALLLFDWDDTLLPTSWIHEQGWLNEEGDLVSPADEIILNRQQQVLLQELEVKVEQTLLTAMGYGRVVIVTNAMEGWVETSCAAFLPGLRPLLDELDIVSARAFATPSGRTRTISSRFEEGVGIDGPAEWKRRAFAEIMEAAFAEGGSRPNVLSIGDSVYEQDAIKAATKCAMSQREESPDIQQLIEEHDLLFHHLDTAVAHEVASGLSGAALRLGDIQFLESGALRCKPDGLLKVESGWAELYRERYWGKAFPVNSLHAQVVGGLTWTVSPADMSMIRSPEGTAVSFARLVTAAFSARAARVVEQHAAAFA
ncbi:unnamed protein product, partial [Effrenium voratum]